MFCLLQEEGSGSGKIWCVSDTGSLKFSQVFPPLSAWLQVAACAKCNSKKDQKTLEEANMKLIKIPKAPKDYDILAIPLTSSAMRMLRKRNGTPQEWRQYLSSSTES
ncbi:hypothetical protein F3Y22_tig00110482pilonHSYRG00575 [Hibiscus syriacus]|uniref:Uncharacterized protein n=1 Tax=Hibiscus syriacus TaxID=106335 RepID=A0A6A3AHC8_HIBSY|nr:hypothetical protein F3Y22_tig00110482pilonHSYRG00575 [Hibiscus syriacus]